MFELVAQTMHFYISLGRGAHEILGILLGLIALDHLTEALHDESIILVLILLKTVFSVLFILFVLSVTHGLLQVLYRWKRCDTLVALIAVYCVVFKGALQLP